MGHKSGEYPFDRFRDTLIGAIIAVVIQMIVHPPNYTSQTSKTFQQFSSHLSNPFHQVSDWVRMGLDKTRGYELQIEIKELHKEIHQVKILIKEAKDSIKYNLIAKKVNESFKNVN